jgi:predicted nucleotidyltransferase
VASKQIWHTRVNEPHDVAQVSDTFLTHLVSELDNEQVIAIILKGSCARGEETLYSDVDLTVFVRTEPEQTGHQRFYREGRLISISTHTIEYYRRRFLVPQEAIFVVPSTREARILLDKNSLFQQLQQEARDWTWEPLQEAANRYACETMQEQTEIALKALRAFLVQDALALAEMTLLIFDATTIAIAVQRGILYIGGNSYFRQVQEAVGLDSTWTRYHTLIAGIATPSLVENPAEVRGIAALRLFQETARLLHPILQVSPQGEVVAQTSTLIEEALAREQLP